MQHLGSKDPPFIASPLLAPGTNPSPGGQRGEGGLLHWRCWGGDKSGAKRAPVLMEMAPGEPEVMEGHRDPVDVEKLIYWCVVNFSVCGSFSRRGTDVLGKGASETKLLSGISLVCSLFGLNRLSC